MKNFILGAIVTGAIWFGYAKFYGGETATVKADSTNVVDSAKAIASVVIDTAKKDTTKK